MWFEILYIWIIVSQVKIALYIYSNFLSILFLTYSFTSYDSFQMLGKQKTVWVSISDDFGLKNSRSKLDTLFYR